jgi:hypothetical protein
MIGSKVASPFFKGEKAPGSARGSRAGNGGLAIAKPQTLLVSSARSTKHFHEAAAATNARRGA